MFCTDNNIYFHPILNAQELTKDEKKAARKARNQEKIDSGKLMITPLAGPGPVGTTAKDFQSWLPNLA